MNTEEQLWNYIDGHCGPKEKLAIEHQLATDLQFNQLYQELLAVHQELQHSLELEEPSMSFTRNVMEQVKLEIRPVALKTKIDKRIVYFIAALFIAPLLGILGYAIAKSDFNVSSTMPKIDFSVNTHKWITPSFIQLFILVDTILALLYLDGYLRKQKLKAQKKGT